MSKSQTSLIFLNQVFCLLIKEWMSPLSRERDSSYESSPSKYLVIHRYSRPKSSNHLLSTPPSRNFFTSSISPFWILSSSQLSAFLYKNSLEAVKPKIKYFVFGILYLVFP